MSYLKLLAVTSLIRAFPSCPAAGTTPGNAKQDCGFAGINSQQCIDQGCCWEAIQPNPGNQPWCFKLKAVDPVTTCPTPGSISGAQKRDCGVAGTNEQQCIRAGCCWQPVQPNPNNEPWCFQGLTSTTTTTLALTVTSKVVPTSITTNLPGKTTTTPSVPSPTLDSCPAPGSIAGNRKVDCGSGSADACAANGCCWEPVSPNPNNEPWCYSKTPGPIPPPKPLPGCQKFDEDKCSGSQTAYPDSDDFRKWQTPRRGSPGHRDSFQDYGEMTAYADVVYSADRSSAKLTMVTQTRFKDAVVECNFGDSGWTTTLTKSFTSSFKGALSLSCRVPSINARLVLDDFYFMWDMPKINRPETENGQKGGIVELFGWPYKDIEKECEFLGKAGYMGLRIWTPNEHLMTDEYLDKDHLNPWYFVYQPVSYRLIARSGSLQELRSMIVTCRKQGVRVFADAVVNHMIAGANSMNEHRNADGNTCYKWGAKNATAGSPSWSHSYTYAPNPQTGLRPALEFPAVPFGPSDFHCERPIRDDDYKNPFVVQYGWLVGLSDLNTEKEYVQDRIATYFATLLSVGFSGFRIDAAKHISPDSLSVIFGKLASKMGGSLPEEFVTWLEVLLGGEAGMLACEYNNYNYYQYLTDVLGKAGLSSTDINKVKIWSADFPSYHPVCGKWIIPSERFAIQYDDHDQQNPGSSPRNFGKLGTVLIKEKDVGRHRDFNRQLFSRTDGQWKIRLVLSSYSFYKGAIGFPDGLSDCSRYTGPNKQYCKGVPYKPAFVADSCGYSIVDQSGNWIEGEYTRTHRDISVINSMRQWLGLGSVSGSDLGLPSRCV